MFPHPKDYMQEDSILNVRLLVEDQQGIQRDALAQLGLSM